MIPLLTPYYENKKFQTYRRVEQLERVNYKSHINVIENDMS